MSKQRVVAIDVGGTTMKGALADAEGNLEDLERRPTERAEGPEAVIDRILSFAVDLARAGRDRYGSDAVPGVGVGVPGLVDEEEGVAVASANLGWERVPLRSLLSERLGMPAVVGHDVRLGGLAEGLVGAASCCTDYLFVALGTGIGAAVVLDGRQYVGAQGVGGELGHMVVDPEGPLCGCGKRGCVEALASAAAVERLYRERSGSIQPVTAQEVGERAEGGDPNAVSVWAGALTALGRALANYAVLLAPELIVIGGGLAEAGAVLFDPLRKEVAAGILFGEPPQIVPAALGHNAGCQGAAFKAWLSLGVRVGAHSQEHHRT